MINQSPPTGSASFEEFKLYYQSTELVTDRRLSMNRFNYSVSVAVIVAIAGILNLTTSKPSIRFVGLCTILVLALIAGFFCTLWLRQIADFKSLNAAKFGVLNEMAKVVVFESDQGSTVARSFEPFDKEWRLLTASGSARPVFAPRMRKLVALKSSTAELFMPQAFRILFAAVFVATLTAALINWHSVSKPISPFSISAIPSPTAKHSHQP